MVTDPNVSPVVVGVTGRDAEPFADEAKRILKAEMVRRGFTFKRLAAVLASLDDGPTESAQTLINKVNRGRFSFAFFIRVCRAMGMSSVDIAPLRSTGSTVGASGDT